jgi:hypothetical protein
MKVLGTVKAQLLVHYPFVLSLIVWVNGPRVRSCPDQCHIKFSAAIRDSDLPLVLRPTLADSFIISNHKHQALGPWEYPGPLRPYYLCIIITGPDLTVSDEPGQPDYS